MKTRTVPFLLPHQFQIAGWILFSVVALWGVLTMLLYKAVDFDGFFWGKHWFLFLMFLCLFLSAGLVAFSKEKQEDEYIHDVRAGSLLLVAAVIFIWFLVYSIFSSFITVFHVHAGFLDDPFGSYVFDRGISPNVLDAFLLYVIVFRVKLFIVKRRMRYDE